MGSRKNESAETLNELQRFSLCLTKNPFEIKGNLAIHLRHP